MRSRRFSTRCKAKERMRAARRYFADLRGATYGRAARKIARALCRFCDTDFVGLDGENGGKYRTADALAAMIAALWPPHEARRFVVCTGGEPMLQLDNALIDALHRARFTVAIET